jgi:hypothetical protein
MPAIPVRQTGPSFLPSESTESQRQKALKYVPQGMPGRSKAAHLSSAPCWWSCFEPSPPFPATAFPLERSTSLLRSCQVDERAPGERAVPKDESVAVGYFSGL